MANVLPKRRTRQRPRPQANGAVRRRPRGITSPSKHQRNEPFVRTLGSAACAGRWCPCTVALYGATSRTADIPSLSIGNQQPHPHDPTDPEHRAVEARPSVKGYEDFQDHLCGAESEELQAVDAETTKTRYRTFVDEEGYRPAVWNDPYYLCPPQERCRCIYGDSEAPDGTARIALRPGGNASPREAGGVGAARTRASSSTPCGWATRCGAQDAFRRDIPGAQPNRQG